MLIKVDADRREASMVVGDKVAKLLKDSGKRVVNYGGCNDTYYTFDIADLIVYVANAEAEIAEVTDKAMLMYGLTEFINYNNYERYSDIHSALDTRMNKVPTPLIGKIVKLCIELNDVWRDSSIYNMEDGTIDPSILTDITVNKIELESRLIELFSYIINNDEIFVLGSWVKTLEFNYMNRAIRDHIDNALVDKVRVKLIEYKKQEISYREYTGYEHRLLNIVALPSLLVDNEEYELFREPDVSTIIHIVGYKVIPKLGHDEEFDLSYEFNEYELEDGKLEEILKEL